MLLSWKRIRTELLGRWVVSFFGFFLIIITLTLFSFLISRGLALFFKHGVSPFDFLFSADWRPDPTNAVDFRAGIAIFIYGSLALSLLAVSFATPFGLGLSIFMAEISPGIGKKVLQPALEIFIGIPSVVYGWVGLSVLVPCIHQYIGGLGFSVLAGSCVLTVMILPTFVSLSYAALKVLPHDYKEAAYALGATRWQSIRTVFLPAALPGIGSALVFSLTRAFGEALAVQMVIGNSVKFPSGLLDSTSNLTSIITMDMGNTVDGSTWNDALWAMALVLLVISFCFILLIRFLGSRGLKHGN